MGKYVVVDGSPVPAKLAPYLREILKRSGTRLNSAYRGADARTLLAKHGKKDQATLYNDYLQGRGNPANPPGRSTHELRSDGVAFPGPIGRRLRWWQVGLDVSDAKRFTQAARELGWTATITYPSNPREQHHVNLRREPRWGLSRWKIRPLRRGDKGPRFQWLSQALSVIEDGRGKTYLPKERRSMFGEDVETAVRRFQRHHNLPVDGKVGYATRVQLGASYRYWKAKRRA